MLLRRSILQLYSHLKARNPTLRRAEQRWGNSHDPYLITCATGRGSVLTLSEIAQHDDVCCELHFTQHMVLVVQWAVSYTYGFNV